MLAKRKENSEKQPCVLISGAYGMGNIGDEAMLQTIIAQLRGISPDVRICVMTRTPAKTKKLYGVDTVYTFNFLGMHSEMKKADLFISGGGCLIQNETSRRSLWYYLHTLAAAKKFGCRVLMYGCGVGPVNGEDDRKTVANVLNNCVDCITLREQDSQGLLADIGVDRPEIVVASDLAFAVKPCSDEETDGIMRKCGLDPNGKYACFCFRPWKGVEEKLDVLCAAVRYTYEELGLMPVFMSMNYRADSDIARRVAERSGVPHVIIPEIARPDMALGLLGRMKLTVAMRLHAALLSVLAGVPVVGISYDPKVSAFTNYVGSDSCLELDMLEYEALVDHIGRAAQSGSRASGLDKLRALGDANVRTLERFV